MMATMKNMYAASSKMAKLLIISASLFFLSSSHVRMASRKLLVLSRNLLEESTLSSTLDEDVLIEVGDAFDTKTTTPLFYHIPKAGGTTVQDITAHCLGLVVASEVGISHEHANDEILGKFAVDDGSKFVNVDTTTKRGLSRAKDLGFAESKLANVVFTGFIPQATNTLFNEEHKASLFGIFRHPARRAISQFYYLQDANWESTYHKEWKNMTLLDYVKSSYVEHDWMIRNIMGKYREKLNESDLEYAKTIVSEKMWVGLISEMDESMSRFGAVYGWAELPQWDACILRFAHDGSNKHSHPEINSKSEVWRLLQEVNEYDIQLYLHAVSVFEEQRKFFVADKEDARRLMRTVVNK